MSGRIERRVRGTGCGVAALLILFGLAGSVPAQSSVVEDWNATLKNGIFQFWGAMIGVDAGDHIYVTGSDPTFLTIVTAKYNASGNALWQVAFDNPGTSEFGAWLAMDPAGNVLVTGYNVTGANRTPKGFVTLKYDPSGSLLWSDVIPLTLGQTVRVAADPAGNVFVLGKAWFGTDDIVTVKYGPDGTLLWMRVAGVSPTTVDSAGSLAVDAAGNVYVTGGTIGTILTVAYDPDGNVLWTRQTPSVGAGVDLTLGPGGVIYVTGAGASQVQLVKYDAAGNVLWSNGYPGIAGWRLKTDSLGNVVVAGYTGTGGYTDWITHKVAPDGTLLWSAVYDRHQSNDEFPYGLLIGPDDEIYVTGQGGPGPVSGNVSYLKTVTVRYSKDGREDWFSANDLSLRGRGVVRLSDNSIATVGESTFTIFHYKQTGVWTSVPGTLAGTSGLPRLSGTGYPAADQALSLELTQARPGSVSWLILGFSEANLPFKGGVLVPSLDFLLPPLNTGPAGALSLPFQWPAGLPSGFETVFQFWILDPLGPQGFAASNGLLAISQ